MKNLFAKLDKHYKRGKHINIGKKINLEIIILIFLNRIKMKLYSKVIRIYEMISS